MLLVPGDAEEPRSDGWNKAPWLSFSEITTPNRAAIGSMLVAEELKSLLGLVKSFENDEKSVMNVEYGAPPPPD